MRRSMDGVIEKPYQLDIWLKSAGSCCDRLGGWYLCPRLHHPTSNHIQNIFKIRGLCNISRLGCTNSTGTDKDDIQHVVMHCCMPTLELYDRFRFASDRGSKKGSNTEVTHESSLMIIFRRRLLHRVIFGCPYSHHNMVYGSLPQCLGNVQTFLSRLVSTNKSGRVHTCQLCAILATHALCFVKTAV
jgi:hypothetical protein